MTAADPDLSAAAEHPDDGSSSGRPDGAAPARRPDGDAPARRAGDVPPAAGSEPERADDASAGFTAAWDEFVLAIRRSQARGPAGQELSLSQYYLLVPLLAHGALPVSQLADLAGISAPTVTRVVDGLQSAGLLARQRSLHDRRTVLVSLTPAGHERMVAKRTELARRRRRLYEALEPGEREQSERLLRHLAQLIAQL